MAYGKSKASAHREWWCVVSDASSAQRGRPRRSSSTTPRPASARQRRGTTERLAVNVSDAYLADPSARWREARLRRPPDGGGVPQSTARQPRRAEGETVPIITQGYTEREYLLSGCASTYSGPVTGPAVLTPAGHAGLLYVTRILVRSPKEPEQFSGRVVIEPFNVSTGADHDALWARIGARLLAHGDAWIGVTARAAAVNPLKRHDPERYADVSIPVNDIEWAILGTLGKLTKQHSRHGPLGPLAVRHAYLGGYSQSGADVSTFALAFGAVTRMPDGSPVFNGYFPAGHAASFTPLASRDSLVPAFEHVPMGAVGVPVVQVETQTDVEGFVAELGPDLVYTNVGGAYVRREDGDAPDDRYRLYEIAGSPHVAEFDSCEGGGSSFPTAAFLRAALRHLFFWAEAGIPPPMSERIVLRTADVVSEADVDAVGNAIGGVRSPFVDLALARYEVHAAPGPFCKLVGRETPLAASYLAARYGDVATYLSLFAERLDETIRAGFLLDDDRAAIVAAAEAQAESAFAVDVEEKSTGP